MRYITIVTLVALFGVMAGIRTVSVRTERFELQDFLAESDRLDYRVDQVFETMSDEERVGQLIVAAAGRLGKATPVVADLVATNKIGGVLLLNGTTDSFKELIAKFDSANVAAGGLGLIYSADAEPTLVNRKIKGTRECLKTNEITTIEECESAAKQISEDLNDIGIHWNYAPVCDMNLNSLMNTRSFGNDATYVSDMCNAFNRISHESGIATTAKHFPGHGNVKGDSHLNLVKIDGEMKEKSIFKSVIDAGVPTVMIGHIAVVNNDKYNTDSKPATLAKNIVTDLLKTELGFRGLVVTDAMGMGGVAKEANNTVEAIKAGCDVILMPEDESKAHAEILAEMASNEEFKKQVYASVKKVIRLKLCLGIIQPWMRK